MIIYTITLPNLFKISLKIINKQNLLDILINKQDTKMNQIRMHLELFLSR